MIEPCTPWSTRDDLPSSYDLTEIDLDVLDSALRYSGAVLFNLFRRRWHGECHDTYRPMWTIGDYETWCRPVPVLASGAVVNASLGQGNVLRLPARYARSVDEVKINDDVLDASTYVLRNSRYVVRLDGSSWPVVSLGTTVEPPSCVVAYTWGEEAPQAAKLASTLLGWEFALAWSVARCGECRLPKTVQAITRNGVSMQMFDWNAIFEKHRTGIPEIDMLISSIEYGEVSRTFVVDPMKAAQRLRGAGTTP